MESFNKFLNKRNIFIFVGILILSELIWAGWTLSRPSKSIAPKKIVSQKVSKPTVVSLTTSQAVVKVGDKVNIDINLSSSKFTDGTDLIILYNPSLLSVDPVSAGSPVKPGKIYTDYPINTVNEKSGKITVSGITSQSGGVVPQGIFGTISFIAKMAGTAKISLDFASGSTSDSNVVEAKTAKDLLDKVENLELSIKP